MRGGDLSKLEFQRLSTNITWELLLLIFERYRPRKQLFLRSGHLYFYTIQSLRTVYFSVLSNNLSNWCHEELFFCANILQKEFNLLQMEQVDLWLHPSLVCERFLVLRCSLTSWLMASLTSPQIYKHILVLKEFSQTTCIILSVQEEGFPVWTSLPLFTVCQTPSVNSDMSNLDPTITPT